MQIFRGLVHTLQALTPRPALAASAADGRLLFAQGDGGRTVRGERRRPGGPSTGRAEAPERERPSSRPSSGGTFGTGGSGGGLFGSGGGSGSPFGNLPGGKRAASPLLIILLVVGFLCVMLITGQNPLDLLGMSGGTGLTEDTGSYTEPLPQEQPEETVAVLPTFTPAASGAVTGGTGGTTGATAGGDTWTIMLYQDADDQVLEKDIFLDLNEAEKVGSTDKVQVVAQLDRFRGGFNGDGNWTSAKRFYVTRDNNLNRIASKEIADLGEVNMADGKTLVDFVTWAIKAYPADKYALILSDHGMGWPGGWSDPTAGSSRVNMPLANSLGDVLYLMEIDQALGQIRAQTGLDKFELIGMDACLMSHIEVLSAMAPHAYYFVGSQETEPSLGWAYASFLKGLNTNPAMSGAELGKLIVNSYITDDERIVDDAARADFAGRGLFDSLAPSASQIAGQLSGSITLTTVDLGAVPALVDSLNNLSYVMQEVEPRAITQARSYAQSFTNIFGDQVPASYIDLGHFAQLLRKNSGGRDVEAAVGQVMTALKQAVVAERHGSGRAGATGVSIYFPNSTLYRTGAAGPQSYTVAAQRFSEESLWDDFLAFHYTGQTFEPATRSAVIPDRAVRAPVQTGVQVSALTVDKTSVAPGDAIRMSAKISGENVGYIKLLVGFIDTTGQSIYLADSDYIQSGSTQELNGVYYPDWGKGDFTLEFDWEPIVFAISDGSTRVEALFQPESYGATVEQATYAVEGTYTFSDTGEQRKARLLFRDGKLRQVFGFTEGAAGAPSEITPQAGDTFTVLETWLDLDSQGKVTATAQQEGKTLTFGNQGFTWEVLDAAPGSYIIGFIVEDLDGAQQTVFKQVTVK